MREACQLTSSPSPHGVRFIFLHTPLVAPQGWKEDASEKVDARNSPCQDDVRAAARGPEQPVKEHQGLVADIAEPTVLPSTRRSTTRGPSAVGCRPAVDSC